MRCCCQTRSGTARTSPRCTLLRSCATARYDRCRLRPRPRWREMARDYGSIRSARDLLTTPTPPTARPAAHRGPLCRSTCARCARLSHAAGARPARRARAHATRAARGGDGRATPAVRRRAHLDPRVLPLPALLLARARPLRRAHVPRDGRERRRGEGARPHPLPICCIGSPRRAAFYLPSGQDVLPIRRSFSEYESECLDPQMSCEPRARRACITTRPEPPHPHPDVHLCFSGYLTRRCYRRARA